MNYLDLLSIIKWDLLIFLIGVVFLPFSSFFFSKFIDKGYIFSKIIGISILSYSIFLLGHLKIMRFDQFNLIILLIIISFIFLVPFIIKIKSNKIVIKDSFIKLFRFNWKFFLFEEIIFMICFFIWSYVRTFNPDILGIEKFMDLAYINSILRAEYLPPKDPWFSPLAINYYYFGHLITAVLTKISQIPSYITFNLMLATIFAFIFSCSLSIILNLLNEIVKIRKAIIGSIFGAFLVTFAGNLTTIYAFFTNSTTDDIIPFWKLIFSFDTFPNSYWYPTATRFIQNSIHELPSYALSLSDLHAHLLDTPVALLSIALCISMFLVLKSLDKVKKVNKILLLYSFIFSFVLAVEYMTNAWDAGIYFILYSGLVILILHSKKEFQTYSDRFNFLTRGILVPFIGVLLFSLPFSLNFKPFVSGIGIVCPPDFLIKLGSIGPLLFEANHCQRSPFWQIFLLYGLFFIGIFSFFLFISKIQKKFNSDLIVIYFSLFGLILVLVPEIIYLKDIYPTHFRANTMFKTAYQAFIIFSIVFAFTSVRILSHFGSSLKQRLMKFGYILIILPFLVLVFLYPFFSIPSSHSQLKNSLGLNGFEYLKKTNSSDYKAINWINKNIDNQPVILEALGDSYTDRGRISVYTGLPTVLEWTSHEWLWRGTYEITAPRIGDIKTLYETKDINEAKKIINKYQISLIYIGKFEKEDYKISENKFLDLGEIIFANGETNIYKIR